MSTTTLRMVLFSGLTLVLGFALGLNAHPRAAQRVETPGVEQELLLNAPLSQFPGKRVTVFTGTFEPGAGTPFHRHPGTELLFVLEGEGVMNIRGREPHALTEGHAVLVEPEAAEDFFIHQAVNLDQKAGMKTLVVVIHDDGTPPALPLGNEQ